MNEQDTTTTEGAPDLTANAGKSDASKESGDPVVAGLSRRLNREIAEKAALAKQLADFLGSDEGTEDKRSKVSKLERENAALTKALQYPELAPAIRGAIAKGVDPSFIDDEFVSLLKMAQSTDVEDSPAHNPARVTGTADANILKGLKSLFED